MLTQHELNQRSWPWGQRLYCNRYYTYFRLPTDLFHQMRVLIIMYAFFIHAQRTKILRKKTRHHQREQKMTNKSLKIITA